MMYQPGNKYNGSCIRLEIYINSFYPGGQTKEGENQYEVSINSYRVRLPETVLALLLAEKIIPVVIEKPIDKPVEVKQVKEVKEVKKTVKSKSKGK